MATNFEWSVAIFLPLRTGASCIRQIVSLIKVPFLIGGAYLSLEATSVSKINVIFFVIQFVYQYEANWVIRCHDVSCLHVTTIGGSGLA